MCGFVFAYRPDLEPGLLKEKTECALRRIEHRGPDDGRLAGNASWLMGHRRLSIIDLAGGRQPMSDPSSRYWFAYNGEVYNFRELRTSLEGRWTFCTQSDTEVVFAGLVTVGADFLGQMEGMWALVLWDSVSRRLLLARDRMGKKPLFYEQSDDRFVCASELPALRCIALTSWYEDEDSTADFFRYGFHLPGYTAFTGVREIMPGHVATWQPGAPPEQRRYWRLSLGTHSGSAHDGAKAVREALIRAVQRRQVADVEVGAFLSGGIDSSLIVGIMSRELGIRPKTFTIGFSEATYDERRYARIAAEAFGTDHRERLVSELDFGRLVELLLQHVGQPFADSSLLPTAVVCEYAAEHVKVALSGDGGDELFSGYQRYLARTLLRWYTRLPMGLRMPAEALIRRIPEPMTHHSGSLIKKAHLFLDIVARHRDEQPYVAPLLWSRADLSLLLPDLAERGHPPPLLPRACGINGVSEMMTADALVYMPQDILVKVDRASMAYSLEVRAPFLDREVVELAFSLPAAWHRYLITGKRMLREAFGELLPKAMWRRRKQGFAVPIHDWFRKGLGEELNAMLAATSSPVDAAFVRSLLRAHQEGRRDHGHRLWLIYAYLIWRGQEKYREFTSA